MEEVRGTEKVLLSFLAAQGGGAAWVCARRAEAGLWAY